MSEWRRHTVHFEICTITTVVTARQRSYREGNVSVMSDCHPYRDPQALPPRYGTLLYRDPPSLGHVQTSSIGPHCTGTPPARSQPHCSLQIWLNLFIMNHECCFAFVVAYCFTTSEWDPLSSEGFHKYTTLAIMEILASEAPWKQKDVTPQWGLNPGLSLTSDSKCNTLLSELFWHVLLEESLNLCLCITWF